MPNGANPGPLHPVVTQRSGYQYFFYTKHHQPSNTTDAQWEPALTQDEEFTVFDLADLHDLSEPNGDLFGLHIGLGPSILVLGTGGQQVAEFPATAAGQAWHGYPLFPLAKRGRGQKRKNPIPTDALDKMEQVGLLTPSQISRLKRGKPI
jgi:hypothetical protein